MYCLYSYNITLTFPLKQALPFNEGGKNILVSCCVRMYPSSIVVLVFKQLNMNFLFIHENKSE